jgi:hypothetical protein
LCEMFGPRVEMPSMSTHLLLSDRGDMMEHRLGIVDSSNTSIHKVFREKHVETWLSGKM